MLSLISSPRNISFSRNPIVYEFQLADSNNLPYLNLNKHAIATVPFNQILAGTAIKILYTDPTGYTDEITFEVVDSPSTNTEIASNNTAGINSYTELIDHWINVMNNHPEASLLFNFHNIYEVGISNHLIVEFKSVLNTSNISIETTGISADVFLLSNNQPAKSYRPSDWKGYIEIWQKEDVNQLITREQIFPTKEGYFAIDIAKIIDTLLEQQRDSNYCPNINDNTPFTIPNNFTNYFIRYRESNDYSDNQSWQESNLLTAYRGGISQSLHASTDFFMSLSSNSSLLTFQPSTKKVSRSQPEWLTYFNYKETEVGIMLEIKWYDINNTATTIHIWAAEQYDVNSKSVISIPCGANQLSIPAEAVYYTIQILRRSSFLGTEIEYLSPICTFIIDTIYHEEEHFFMYLNHFSCLETFRCVGHYKKNRAISSQIRQHILQPIYSAEDRQLSKRTGAYTHAYIYRTPILTKKEMEEMVTAQIASEVWKVTDSKKEAFLITNTKFLVHDSEKDLHYIEFSMSPLLPEYNPDSVATGELILDNTGSSIADDSGATLFPN